MAPVTRRSGKWEMVVVCRFAGNGHLRNAVQAWAFTSTTASGWAREYYDQQRDRKKNHHAALRALGNRWLEILWHCLKRGVLYDEAVHVANRNRALGRPRRFRGSLPSTSHEPAGEAADRPLTVGAPPRTLAAKGFLAARTGTQKLGVWGRGRSAVKGRADMRARRSTA